MSAFSLRLREVLVSASERLTRFIFRTSHFKNGEVLPTAFLPHPRRLDCSCYRIRTDNENTIWRAGKKIGAVSKRSVKARADFDSAIVFSETKLEIDFDTPTHANVINWPKDKEDQLEIAQILCERSLLVEKPVS